MKEFFDKYQDWLLGVFAFFFSVFMTVYFIWGILVLAESFNKATSRPQSQDENLQFDIEGFEKLNLGS